MPARLICCCALMALAACGSFRDRISDGGGDYGGTVVVSTGADADVLVPMLTHSVQGAQIGQLIFELLALPGDNLGTFGDEGFTPVLAESWTWASDSLSIAFHIHPAARWHDGAPVRAEDVAFTHRLYMNPATATAFAPLLRNIDSVTVADSLTAVFWFSRRYLEQFFEAAYQMRILPKHLLDTIPPERLKSSEFARQPVGSGPFRFVRWVPGSMIELTANTDHYRGRPHLDRLIWTIAPDPGTASTRLFSGEADFLDPLRPESMSEFARVPDVRAVTYPSLFQGFLLFNLRDRNDRQRPHPLFGEREMRRALSMAIDRERLVRSVYDSLALVAVGPVPRVLAGPDTNLEHTIYDLEEAQRLLDSLGWRPRADGFRAKDGRQLRFSIAVPTSSAPRMRMGVLLQEMMRQAGVRVDLEQMEFNTFVDRQVSRRFDTVIGAWLVDPSPSSIRQLWSTPAARARDGSNFGSYESARFDALVDSATMQLDPATARRYLRQAYTELLTDAPAVFLFETVSYAGMHRRIVPGKLRADGWWLTLHEWSVPADQRIARDGITTVPASND